MSSLCLSFLVCLLLLAVLASSQRRQHSVVTEREMKKRYLDVVGTASVATRPDTAFVTLLMQTIDPKSAAQAYAANNRAINALVAMLKAQDIPSKDASSSEFSLAPVYSYPQNQKQLDGFMASQSLVVKVRDLSKVTSVLDGALSAASLVQIVSVSYVVEDTAGIAIKARAEAVADARDKARRLVDLSGPGVALGRPLSIHEDEAGAPNAGSAYMQAKSFRGVGAMDDGGGATSLPGETRVRHTVYITYELLLVEEGGGGEGETEADGGVGAASGAGTEFAANSGRGRGRGRGRGQPRRRRV